MATCSVSDCNRRVLARGWCGLHYQRWSIHGSPSWHPPTFTERFWAKVDRSGECWAWTGYRMPSGHGLFGRGGRGNGMALAHRVSWELHYGPIPEGMKVCHHCDHGWCVRPDHLFLGTQADNLADMRAKGRGRGAPRGSAHPKSRLTEAQARYIKGSGRTLRDLAAEYGVSATSIRHIKIGRSWSWLEASRG